MPILTLLMPFLTKIFDLIPDPAQRAKNMQDIINALQQWDSQQSDINKIEAASNSWVARNWRPAIAWAGAINIWMVYIVSPLVIWVCIVTHSSIPPLPKFDSNMMELVYLLLGMGGFRTFEKIKGVTK